jgi:beta-lactamase class A
METITRRPAIFAIGSVIFGLLLVWGGYAYGAREIGGERERTEGCHRTFNLLDQNLDCEKIEDVSGRIPSIETDVTKFIEQAKAEKKIHRVGVFYRDLSTRRWFGVNADSEFYPASLAKLPLAVAYYKVGDLELSIFDQQIPLTVSKEYSNVGQKVSVDSPMVAGSSYSVRRMIEDMLIYSDNRPIGPLISFMREDVWKKVYSDLGVRKQTDSGEESWSVTPRVVALIFRSLFNGSYLDLESSQELLGVMTKARYMKGLAAGVDAGTPVAHKFGEATMVEGDGALTPVLHDCGIVYKPGEPYILCVMTEGKDFEELEKAIAGISAIVYRAQ